MKTLKAKVIPIILGIAIVGLTGYYGYALYTTKYPRIYTIGGYVKYVSPAEHSVTITKETGEEVTVTNVPDDVSSTSGQDVRLEEIAQGWGFESQGTPDKKNASVFRAQLATAKPIAGIPCATCLTEAKNGATLSARLRSRIMIELPADKYAQSALSIAPASTLAKLGLEIPAGVKWVVIYQPVKTGTVTISVPGKNSSVAPFRATVTISE